MTKKHIFYIAILGEAAAKCCSKCRDALIKLDKREKKRLDAYYKPRQPDESVRFYTEMINPMEKKKCLQ